MLKFRVIMSPIFSHAANAVIPVVTLLITYLKSSKNVPFGTSTPCIKYFSFPKLVVSISDADIFPIVVLNAASSAIWKLYSD